MALPNDDSSHKTDAKVPTSRVLYWRVGVILAIVLIAFWQVGLALILATIAIVWFSSGKIDLAEGSGHDPRHLP
jgi:hypothetical protein